MDLISRKEFSRRTGCNYTTIVQACIKGRIPVVYDPGDGLTKIDYIPGLQAYADFGNKKAQAALIKAKAIEKNKPKKKFIYVPGKKKKSSPGKKIQDYDINNFKAGEAKEALDVIKVKKALLDLKISEGKYIDEAIVLSVFSSVAESTKQAILSVPNRVSSMLVGLEMNAINRILVDELHRALEELSTDIIGAVQEIEEKTKNVKSKETRRRKTAEKNQKKVLE